MAKIKFNQSKSAQVHTSDKTWKILIADDELAVHELTKAVLGRFKYDNKYLELISAYNGVQAIELLKEHDDVVLILLDVVMECDNAGLIVVKKIREELNNNNIQIILRTGQAGKAPELEVVTNYAINDYKEKSELTSQKLHTSIITAIRSYQHLKTLEENKIEIENLNKEIIETQKEVIFKMGAIGEARSKETGQHVRRVAEYSKLFALLLGIPEFKAEILKQASPMHDIGKVAIFDSILNKPGKLTPEEFEIMKTHAQLGYEMLESSNRAILKVAAIVSHEHHERWDGKGYPNGLKGKNIHVYGRITAVADVFDALGSNRIYKKAWSDEKIFNFFKEQSGKHFDPEIIEVFFENLNDFMKIRDEFKDN